MLARMPPPTWMSDRCDAQTVELRGQPGTSTSRLDAQVGWIKRHARDSDIMKNGTAALARLACCRNARCSGDASARGGASTPSAGLAFNGSIIATMTRDQERARESMRRAHDPAAA